MNNDLISRSALLADLREKGFLPEIVQRSIERAPAVDAVEIPPTGVGDLSDGYHTFNELYHHRAILFSVICNNHPEIAWKSMHHNDPNSPMYDGMFIVGIETPQGQATYHYDIDPYWDMFKVKELDRAPAWDGHTPDEAIRRIELLGDVSPAADAVDAVEYVERKALRDALYDADAITMSGVKILNQFPSADVAPVRHGRWIEKDKYTFGVMYDCSICGNRILDNGHSWNYCPNCGARMDEVSE